MPVSADDLQLSIVEQVSGDVIPTNPVFQVMRLTGEGLTFAYESTNSNELGGSSRGVRDSILTGGAVSGDLNFELHSSATMDNLLAALLGSDWGDDPLGLGITDDEVYVGSEKKIFLAEKRWLLSPGNYDYHRFLGCVIDTLSLTITPGEPITGSFGLVGSTLETGLTAISGATYQSAGSSPVMTAPLVKSINLYDEHGALINDVQTTCFTSLGINAQNGTRGIPCVGTLGTRETVLGRFEATLDYSIYFSNDDMLDSLRDQSDMRIVIELEDSRGNSYTLEFPRVRVSTAEVNASGSGEDVLVTGQMTALVGSAPNEYSLLIRRVKVAGDGTGPAPVAPPAPIEVAAAGFGASSTAATFTVTVDTPADVLGDETVTWSVTPDGGTPITGTFTPTAGDDADAVASDLAAAIDGHANLAAEVNGVDSTQVDITPAGSTTFLTAGSVTVETVPVVPTSTLAGVVAGTPGASITITVSGEAVGGETVNVSLTANGSGAQTFYIWPTAGDTASEVAALIADAIDGDVNYAAGASGAVVTIDAAGVNSSITAGAVVVD